MLYKLLSVSKSEKISEINIGDYIQALASSQYYPHMDGFIDRDEDLKEYDGPPCKVIMNGWYMHNPKNWPPSDKIKPLFVAFHLNVLAKSELTSQESISYMKQYEPIGCRDIGTMNLLKEKGVNAYFSGCMTLTLGKKYHSEEKDGKIYIVDPLIETKMGVKDMLLSLWQFIKFPHDIIKLFMNKGLHIHHGKNRLKEFIKTALFHKIYSNTFSREIVVSSTYICQQNKYYLAGLKTDEERLHEAERLVRKYAKSKLVITSRIHCALPCLGLDTPVIFLKKYSDTKESACRLGGLSDLFNTITVKGHTLTPTFTADLKHGEIPVNKTDWKILADSLDERCELFIKER